MLAVGSDLGDDLYDKSKDRPEFTVVEEMYGTLMLRLTSIVLFMGPPGVIPASRVRVCVVAVPA